LFSQLGEEVTVIRNDAISVEECVQLAPERLVISPGPSWPKDAGISKEVIKAFAGKIPVLGVCLGHQSMFEVFGGTIQHVGEIVHGKTSKIQHDGKGVYVGVPNGIEVIRYHSLAGKPDTLPNNFIITSTTQGGVIMGIRHTKFTMEGVQFHPESIKTEYGMEMLKNFTLWKGGSW